MAKGGSYEREVCRQLSLWWSHDTRDDLFWRTAGSGARATVRAKTGRKTAGHCGDVGATDAVGKPLMDFLTLELKRGYTRHTMSNVLDYSPRSKLKQETYEAWIVKALTAASNAGSLSWAVVHRRDGRDHTILTPEPIADALSDVGSRWAPAATFRLPVRGLPGGRTTVALVMDRLSTFYADVSPRHVVAALAKFRPKVTTLAR